MKPIATIVTLVSSLLLFSCGNQRFLDTKYHGDVTELIRSGKQYEYTIRPDDKLTLSIWNHDNLSVGSLFSIYNSNEAYGKWVLVDTTGHVNLPQLGMVPVEGMSVRQLADTLTRRYAEYLVDPIIVVKVLNREVTILGEVKSPGNYILEKEVNGLYELIGRAQGLTAYSDVKHVQVIRKDTSYIVNLSQLTPEYSLNLESDDILYIPSKRGKIIDQKAPTIIPFASAITAAAVFFSVFNK